MLPSAHLSPETKWQIDQIIHFCTAHGRVSLWNGDAQACPFPNNCPFTCGIWPNPNSISISSAVFAQIITECPYTLQWDSTSPLKSAPSHGVSGPHLIHGSLGQPKWHLDQFSHFAGLTSVTDRQTKRPHYSVSKNRLHLRT